MEMLTESVVEKSCPESEPDANRAAANACKRILVFIIFPCLFSPAVHETNGRAGLHASSGIYGTSLRLADWSCQEIFWARGAAGRTTNFFTPLALCLGGTGYQPVPAGYQPAGVRQNRA
jgi:hypothetical protein